MENNILYKCLLKLNSHQRIATMYKLSLYIAQSVMETEMQNILKKEN